MRSFLKEFHIPISIDKPVCGSGVSNDPNNNNSSFFYDRNNVQPRRKVQLFNCFRGQINQQLTNTCTKHDFYPMQSDIISSPSKAMNSRHQRKVGRRPINELTVHGAQIIKSLEISTSCPVTARKRPANNQYSSPQVKGRFKGEGQSSTITTSTSNVVVSQLNMNEFLVKHHRQRQQPPPAVLLTQLPVVLVVGEDSPHKFSSQQLTAGGLVSSPRKKIRESNLREEQDKEEEEEEEYSNEIFTRSLYKEKRARKGSVNFISAASTVALLSESSCDGNASYLSTLAREQGSQISTTGVGSFSRRPGSSPLSMGTFMFPMKQHEGPVFQWRKQPPQLSQAPPQRNQDYINSDKLIHHRVILKPRMTDHLKREVRTFNMSVSDSPKQISTKNRGRGGGVLVRATSLNDETQTYSTSISFAASPNRKRVIVLSRESLSIDDGALTRLSGGEK